MLKRGIQKWDLVLLMINSVIGAGIFGLPSKIFALSGFYSLFAFFICAVIVLIIILCFAEVSSRFQKTGGPYLYILEAFGRVPAFGMGWLLLLSRFFNYAALINLMVVYLSLFSPIFNEPFYRILTITVFTLFLAAINFLGIRDSVRLNNILTVSKLVPLFAFIVIGLFFIQPQLLQASQPLEVASFSRSVMLLIFAFGGFESILINTGEIINPRKTLPFALITAIIVIAVFYCLIQLVSMGTLPELAASERPLADAAGYFMGTYGGKIMAAGAFISIFGTLNAIMLSGSRLPFALSEEKQFPKFLSYVHPRFRTPSWSLVVFTLVTIYISVTGSFITSLSIAVIIRILIYFLVCASLIKFRLREKNKPGDFFKVRYGYALAITGMLTCTWLITHSNLKEFRDLGYAIAAGVVVFIIHKLTSSNQPLKKVDD
jgi:amino acid transporter